MNAALFLGGGRTNLEADRAFVDLRVGVGERLHTHVLEVLKQAYTYSGNASRSKQARKNGKMGGTGDGGGGQGGKVGSRQTHATVKSVSHRLLKQARKNRSMKGTGGGGGGREVRWGHDNPMPQQQ